MKKVFQQLLKVAPIRVTYGIIAAIVIKLPRIAFFVLSFFAIFWVGQQLYYRYAPPEQFLDFYYAKVDDTPVGTDPLMTLCRRINYDGIRIEAARTFIELQDETGKQITSGEYNFSANVEKGDSNCTNVRLKKQPQKAGTYKAITEYVFFVGGNRKSGSYETNLYKMNETTLTLNQQIEVLQQQINVLKEQLEAQGQAVPETPTIDNVPQITAQPPTSTQNIAPSAPQTPQQPQDEAIGGGLDSVPPPTPPAPCIVPLLGGGLFCGGSLIRL